MKRRPRAIALLTTYAVILLAGSPAHAGADMDESSVERLVERVLQQVKAAQFAPTLVAGPLDKSKKAITRARSARAAGDGWHSRLLQYLAGEWAQTADATLRAAKAERDAEIAATKAHELRTKLERARALLTEQQARRGRLRAEVNKAEQLARDAAKATAKKEEKRLSAAERWRSKATKGGAKKKQPRSKKAGGKP